MARLTKTLISTATVGMIDSGIGIGQISHKSNMQPNANSICTDVLYTGGSGGLNVSDLSFRSKTPATNPITMGIANQTPHFDRITRRSAML